MVREGVVAALPGRPALRPAEVRLARSRGCSRGARRCAAAAASGLPTRSRGSGPPMSSSASSWRRGPTSSAPTSPLDLALLQDRMETFPKAEAVAEIEASLGRPIGELYESFGEPVAAASIAQVHPATVMRNGEPVKVAVKVIRPGVRRLFLRDLKAISSPRACRSASSPRRAGCVRSRSPRRSPRPPGSRWTCGSRLPHFPSLPRTRATIPASAFLRSTGSAPAATCSPWTGSTASSCPTSRACAPPATTSRRSPRR